MKIAAIVVTYNRKNLLLECIQALSNQTERELLDIIIIDNASTDGTQESLCSLIESGTITYLNTGANLGGAGGFQFGIRYAAERKYDRIWIMDDDCIPDSRALEKMLEADNSLHGEYGFLSSKVLWTDGSLCTMNIQRGMDKMPDHGIARCRQATFVSLMFPYSVIESVGLPIKEFFIWGDDIEYTRRISSKFDCYFVADSMVVHKTAHNTGSNIAKDDMSRLNRYLYAYRNEIYSARHESWKRCVYQFCRIVHHILRVLFVAKDNKINRIKVIIRGSLNGLSFDPQVEYLN